MEFYGPLEMPHVIYNFTFLAKQESLATFYQTKWSFKGPVHTSPHMLEPESEESGDIYRKLYEMLLIPEQNLTFYLC